MISLYITDNNFVNQIDEGNRFPHQICVNQIWRGILTFYAKKTLNVQKWYNMNEINCICFFCFFVFVLFFCFFFLIQIQIQNCIVIKQYSLWQLNKLYKYTWQQLCKSNWRRKSVSTSNMCQSSSCPSNYLHVYNS
jgi:hypothetical protein